MSVSRQVLSRSGNGWQKFSSKIAASLFGTHIYHYRSRHSPDLVWESSKSSSQWKQSDFAPKERKQRFAKPYTTWNGFAGQTSNVFYERRVYFLFVSTMLLIKTSQFVGFMAPIPIDRVYTKLLVCCQAIRYAARWRYKEDITCAIDFFTWWQHFIFRYLETEWMHHGSKETTLWDKI